MYFIINQDFRWSGDPFQKTLAMTVEKKNGPKDCTVRLYNVTHPESCLKMEITISCNTLRKLYDFFFTVWSAGSFWVHFYLKPVGMVFRASIERIAPFMDVFFSFKVFFANFVTSTRKSLELSAHDIWRDERFWFSSRYFSTSCFLTENFLGKVAFVFTLFLLVAPESGPTLPLRQPHHCSWNKNRFLLLSIFFSRSELLAERILQLSIVFFCFPDFSKRFH